MIFISTPIKLGGDRVLPSDENAIASQKCGASHVFLEFSDLVERVIANDGCKKKSIYTIFLTSRLYNPCLVGLSAY